VRSMSRPEAVILGIDGADPDLIGELLRAGQLPNLAQLAAAGAWGALRSTMPPVTPCAWNTIYTGVEPAKHGVIGFALVPPGTYSMTYTDSTHRLAPAFWELLNEAGLTTGIFQMPYTYPVEPLTGYMVSGIMGTPALTPEATHPPELCAEILAAHPHHSLSWPTKSSGEPDIDKLLDHMDSEEEVCLHLLRQHTTDVFAYTVGYVDFAQHHYLLTRRAEARNGLVIEDLAALAYARADRLLGKLMEAVGDNTLLFVVSDHGGAIAEYLVDLDRLTDRFGGAFGGAANEATGEVPSQGGLPARLSRWLQSARAARVRALGVQMLPRCLTRSVSVRSRTLQWSRQHAFLWNPSTYAYVTVNLHGREPEGRVAPESYEDVIRQVMEWASGITAPDTGESLYAAVRGEEALEGDSAIPRPDLALMPAQSNIAALNGPARRALRGTVHEGRLVIPVAEALTCAEAPALRAAEHSLKAVLFASGPGITAGARVDDGRLRDFAPTLLHTLGLPVPGYMDGRVLSEILTPGQSPPTFSDRPMTRRGGGEVGTPYTEAESAAVEAKLADLGYV